jgi:hypothetical protein
MPEQTSPLRQRMIGDMKLRNMSLLTQAAYMRAVKNFSKQTRSPHKCLAKPSLAGRKVSWSSLRNPFIAP